MGYGVTGSSPKVTDYCPVCYGVIGSRPEVTGCAAGVCGRAKRAAGGVSPSEARLPPVGLASSRRRRRIASSKNKMKMVFMAQQSVKQ